MGKFPPTQLNNFSCITVLAWDLSSPNIFSHAVILCLLFGGWYHWYVTNTLSITCTFGAKSGHINSMSTRRTNLIRKIIEVKLDAGSPLWDKEFWQIDAALEVWFVSEVLYTITLALIKSSILFLYTRIFPTKSFRRYVWGTQIFNLMIVLGFVPVDFFQCRPLTYFWRSCEFSKVP